MIDKKQPNVWAQWDPLKLLAVGASYPPEYYEPIRNNRVKDLLQKIAVETEEDYLNLISVVESYGAEVVRPELPTTNIEIDISMSHGPCYSAIPKPPMTPRDNVVVLGNKCLITSSDCFAYNSLIYKYLENNSIINPWAAAVNPDVKKYALTADQHFFAPSITRVGNRLFVDNVDHPWLIDYFNNNFNEFETIEVTIGGHSDGVFSPIKPGALLSVAGNDIYKNTFPDWEVLFLPNQSWDLVQPWLELKEKNNGKWWIEGQPINDDLIEFVETWFNSWVGYVEETVFDVNCLVLDQHHVCFSNYNQQVWEFCKRHDIEAIEVPFRHRYFWDGGLHCITLDLVRDGDCQSYFQ